MLPGIIHNLPSYHCGMSFVHWTPVKLSHRHLQCGLTRMQYGLFLRDTLLCQHELCCLVAESSTCAVHLSCRVFITNCTLSYFTANSQSVACGEHVGTFFFLFFSPVHRLCNQVNLVSKNWLSCSAKAFVLLVLWTDSSKRCPVCIAGCLEPQVQKSMHCTNT